MCEETTKGNRTKFGCYIGKGGKPVSKKAVKHTKGGGVHIRTSKATRERGGKRGVRFGLCRV